MCQKTSPLLNVTFSVFRRLKCVCGMPEGGSEGTGRLKLMLDHSHRGEEGPESVYQAYVAKELVEGGSAVLCETVWG